MAKKKAKKKKKSGNHLNKIKYYPSEELAKVVGSRPLSRGQVMKKVWAYIKEEGCQDRRTILPRGTLLEDVLGPKNISMFEMTKVLSKHLELV